MDINNMDCVSVIDITTNFRFGFMRLGTAGWDMDTDATKIREHGLSDRNQIYSISVRIKNDAADHLYDFRNPGGASQAEGFIDWDDTNIYLTRRAGGFFDNANFSGGGTRGIMLIIYNMS